MSIYDNLDPDQLKAVQYGDGPLLVVATAGSGKTRVLTHRIAHLIQTKRAAPEQILATTFTKKAAQEMQARVVKLVGPSAERVWMSTVHRTCKCLLCECGPHLVGLSHNFSIYDTKESLAAMNQVTKKLGLPADTTHKAAPDSKGIRKSIEEAKERGLGPAEYAEFSANGKLVEPYYREYNALLRESNAVDFGDLQFLAVEMLRNNPDVLEKVQERFKYILIDEYQDTNNIQADLFKLLAGKSNNITVVGDPCQAIYSFRFANPDHICYFTDDWPEAKVLTLSTNYRSTPNIVRASSEVINNNPTYYDVDLHASRPEGVPVLITCYADDVVTANNAARLVLHYQQKHVPLSEMGVLYRARHSSRALETAFRAHHIPCKVIGDFPFYERQEVKDLLAYLRLMVNPTDRAAFARVVKTPPRGVGDGTISAIVAYATAQNITLIEAARTIPNVRKKQREGLDQVIALLDEFTTLQDSPGLVETIVDVLGYATLLQKGDDADDKLGNVRELITSYAQFCQQLVRPDKESTVDDSADQIDAVRFQRMFTPDETTAPVSPPAAYLEYVMLSRAEEKSVETVQISTIHAAKGKEYGTVIVVGCEDGRLPLARTLMEPAELEEERRVFYVAMTRAKDHLHLVYSRECAVFKDGEMVYRTLPPSRFLTEAIEGGAVET